MSEWKSLPLGSLVSFQKGRKVETSEHPRDGFAPYLGASAISGQIEEYGDTRIGVIASPGDVLMLWDGERSGLVGKAQFGVISSTVARLSPKADIEGEYLFYSLNDNFEWIQNRRTGTGVPHVPKDLARILSIKFPSNKIEQRRIAAILSTLDTTIEHTEALIAKYRQIKAGLMHDLFTRGVLPNGKLRPTREEAPGMYRETKIGWVPKEWEVKRIADVFEIQLGKMLSKLAKTGRWSAPYIGNRAVQWDYIDCSDIEEMDFTPGERQKFALLPGDLLVCEGGDVGRTAMWRNEIEGCFYQKAIHRLRPKTEQAIPAFMLRFMKFAKENGYFREFTSQSSIAHLTQEKLGAIPMQLPEQEEQSRIADRFNTIDEFIQSETGKLGNLRQQKSGLMSDLLSGRVPVKLSGNIDEG